MLQLYTVYAELADCTQRTSAPALTAPTTNIMSFNSTQTIQDM